MSGLLHTTYSSLLAMRITGVEIISMSPSYIHSLPIPESESDFSFNFANESHSAHSPPTLLPYAARPPVKMSCSTQGTRWDSLVSFE